MFEQPQRQWLSVDQAFVICQQAGLSRTKKTIRTWCRKEHVDAEKQVTPTGDQWMIEKSSLEVKVQHELEFQNQKEPVRTMLDTFEQVQTEVEPVRTRPDTSELGRTSSNEYDLSDATQELHAKIDSLVLDKAVRDKQIEFLTKQNAEGFENLLSQSRYIGHLETKVVQLGGEPDQTFLSAPVARPSAEPNNPQQIRFDVD